LIAGTIAAGASRGGPYFVSVTATDGTYGGTAGFGWAVTHGGNRAPTLTNPGSQAGRSGDVAALALSASDPDGDVLTFSATGLPFGLAVDPGSGVIQGSFDPYAVSATPYAVTVSV